MVNDMENDINEHTNIDMGYTERAYTTSETATMLNMAVPTIRKYSQSLERAGYTFLKGKGTGSHQSRLFLEKDLSALRYLKDMREKGSMTVEQATSVVVTKFKEEAIQPIRSNDIQYNDLNDERYDSLISLIEKQNEMINQLSDQLSQQQDYIDKRLDEQERRGNERDQALMQSINESLETQKQLAASKKKKGFFAKLFGKGDDND